MINKIKEIFKKSDYENYYNKELAEAIIELIKKTNKYKISIIKKDKYKNKYLNKNRYIYQYKILINSKNANFGIEIANKSSGFLLYDLDNSDIDYISLYNIDLFIDIINKKIATS